jgi:hypothetical protein
MSEKFEAIPTRIFDTQSTDDSKDPSVARSTGGILSRGRIFGPTGPDRIGPVPTSPLYGRLDIKQPDKPSSSQRSTPSQTTGQATDRLPHNRWITVFCCPSDRIDDVVVYFLDADARILKVYQGGGNWVSIEFDTEEAAANAVKTNPLWIDSSLAVICRPGRYPFPRPKPPELETAGMPLDPYEQATDVGDEVDAWTVFKRFLSRFFG